MDLAQVSLDIAMNIQPSWSGTATNVGGTNVLTDPTLTRAGEHLNGTLWVLGSTPTLYEVKSHSEARIELRTAPALGTGVLAGDDQTLTYFVSTVTFQELLKAINTVLQGHLEMAYEDITIDSADVLTEYPITCSDIRQVELIPTDITSLPTFHHYWREVMDRIVFYYSEPAEDGVARLHYPQRIPVKTLATDLLPARLNYPKFLNACLQAMLRARIASEGRDKPVNYELMNDVKDLAAEINSREIFPANMLLPYATRFHA